MHNQNISRLNLVANSKTSTFTFFLFIAILFTIIIPIKVHAVGVSPSRFDVSNLANGITVEKTVNISRPNPSKNQIAEISLDSGHGSRYVVLPKKTLDLPKGEYLVPYTFQIKPVNAPNGSYESLISFILTEAAPLSETEGGNTVNVRSGVIAKVKFEVTDQEIKKYKIESATIADVTEPGLPLAITVNLLNEGNVDVRPERVQLSLTHVDDPEYKLHTEIDGSAFKFVAPGENGTVGADAKFTKEELKLGSYNAKLVILSEEKEIYRKENLFITVHPEGSLAQSAEFKTFEIIGDGGEPGSLVKFVGEIKNTGEVNVAPAMVVEISQEEEILDILRSEEQVLQKGQLSEQTITFRPEEKGDYTAKAHFAYGIKKTNALEKNFKIGKNNPWLMIAGAAVIILLVLGIAVLIIRRFLLGKRGRDVQQPPVQQPPVQQPPVQQPPVQQPPVQQPPVQQPNTEIDQN